MDAIVSLFARVTKLTFRVHMTKEATGNKVESNTLMPLTRWTAAGAESPTSQPAADPIIREQVKGSDTLMRRVQSLAINPISAELAGNVDCHEILNNVLEIRWKKTAAGGISVWKPIQSVSSGTSVTAETFNR